MLRLTERRREVLADKVSDVANLIAAAIVVGLVVGEPNISLPVVFGMAGIWITVLGFALWIVERRS